MNKQHVRKGREGKLARQDRANNPPEIPNQVWDDETKEWIHESDDWLDVMIEENEKMAHRMMTS